MKLLLLTALLIMGFCASSQTFRVDVPRIMKQSGGLKLFRGTTSSEGTHSEGLPERFPISVTGKKANPGIYLLPQDNMPCLVPDTKDIALMPNAWPQVQVPFRSAIPNPGLLDKPLTDQQKTTTK